MQDAINLVIEARSTCEASAALEAVSGTFSANGPAPSIRAQVIIAERATEFDGFTMYLRNRSPFPAARSRGASVGIGL